MYGNIFCLKRPVESKFKLADWNWHFEIKANLLVHPKNLVSDDSINPVIHTLYKFGPSLLNNE